MNKGRRIFNWFVMVIATLMISAGAGVFVFWASSDVVMSIAFGCFALAIAIWWSAMIVTAVNRHLAAGSEEDYPCPST